MKRSLYIGIWLCCLSLGGGADYVLCAQQGSQQVAQEPDTIYGGDDNLYGHSYDDVLALEEDDTSGIEIQEIPEIFFHEVTDTSSYLKASFARDFKAKYEGDEDFSYGKDYKPEKNLLELAIDRFVRFIRALFDLWGVDQNKLTRLVWNIFYVSLTIGGLYILIRLLLKHRSWLFSGKKDVLVSDPEQVGRHIHQVDFDVLIAQALLREDFRLAVRFYYLRLLRVLSEKGLIEWYYEKTDYQYQCELSGTVWSEPFGYACYLYNYLWYGSFGISREQFDTQRVFFEGLLERINSVRA